MMKYIISIIFLLVLIFFGMGIYTTSVIYECKITVDKPVKEAWAVLQDESKVSEWILGYQRTEHISGTPRTKGAVSNVYVLDQGEETVMKEGPSDVAIKPVNKLSYSELRDRLPKEITDDIVRLIASSPQALEDFATIATQQDVDQFNRTYSVNLVLPAEA